MSSFGEDLKRERELRKISLREIAESTKINIRYLDALENNDFGRLPGGVFNKGFVRAYAQHIGVDEEDMVNAYLLEEQARGGGAGSLEGEPLRGNYGERFQEAGDLQSEPSDGRKRGKLILGLVSIVVVAALVFLGWKYFSGDDPAPDTEEIAPPAAVETTDSQAAPEQPAENPSELRQETPAEPKPAQDPAEEKEPSGVLEVEITLARPTAGRLNCDNRQIEMLDRLAAGITIPLRCEQFLLVDAEDGGALLLSTAGGDPAPMAADGVPLRQHRLVPETGVE